LILDTKYKKDGADSSDYYQATAYSLKLNCDTILLLPQRDYPLEYDYKISEKNLHIYTRTILFSEDEDVDIIKDLKEQILNIVKPFLPSKN